MSAAPAKQSDNEKRDSHEEEGAASTYPDRDERDRENKKGHGVSWHICVPQFGSGIGS